MDNLISFPQSYKDRLAAGKDWREVVAWVGDLPPMPHVAAKAMRVIEDPNASAKEITEILTSDSSLAARVLKIANSAMFARQREITTLSQAITVIGLKALKGIIIGATLKQLKSPFEELQKLVWENSMGTAFCASHLTKKIGKKYHEEMFLNGLLHSLGQIVLLTDSKTPELYVQVLKIVKECNVDWVTAELQVFGFSHSLIGALVAKKWNFSEETCQIILHCKDPLTQADMQSEMESKATIVRLADALTHEGGVGSPPGYPLDEQKISECILALRFPKDEFTELRTLLTTEVKGAVSGYA
jgi:HD-like signal output (HDOD) protein